MIVNIIGLGATAKDFKPDGTITIGVNDVSGCDYQVCVDRPSAFNNHRFMKIVDLRLDHGIDEFDTNEYHGINGFFSQIDEWRQYMDIEKHNGFTKNTFTKISLKAVHAHNNRWNEFIPSSNNSPFVACGVAYKYFGAAEIRLWGVDFNDHPTLNGAMRDAAVKDFILLQRLLNERGSVIVPHKDSYLFNKI